MAQELIRTSGSTGTETTRWPMLILLHRFVLFFIFQAIIAGAVALSGAPNPWSASVAWWPVVVVVTNVISVSLLRTLARREGLSWRQLISADFSRQHLRKDLLALLGVLVLAAPVAMLPNTMLAEYFFGDAEAALGLFIQPLPVAVALAALVLFPVTQGIAELPTYYAYVMPRLEKRWRGKWAAIGAAALWLGLQHLTLPLIFDLRFILWRGLMFIPFALLLGAVLHWRPRLLPYLMFVHVLIDFPVAMMVYMASVGG